MLGRRCSGMRRRRSRAGPWALCGRGLRLRGGRAAARVSCCRICNNCRRRQDLRHEALQPLGHHRRRLQGEFRACGAVPQVGHRHHRPAGGKSQQAGGPGHPQQHPLRDAAATQSPQRGERAHLVLRPPGDVQGVGRQHPSRVRSCRATAGRGRPSTPACRSSCRWPRRTTCRRCRAPRKRADRLRRRAPGPPPWWRCSARTACGRSRPAGALA